MPAQSFVLAFIVAFCAFTSWLMWKWSVDSPSSRPYTCVLTWYSITITCLYLYSTVVLHQTDLTMFEPERSAVHLFPAVTLMTELFLFSVGMTNLIRRGKK